jgi:tRNA 2-selenouridine synthase
LDKATVAQLGDFDEFVDVRSPAEFEIDHIPGAVNCPVLDNEERVRIGTLYKQASSFAAKKAGAALVAANIARHLKERFIDRPSSWRPLLYCWRGGKRSAAMAHVLREIGWQARTLDGGYRAYRQAVLEDLQSLPGKFRWRVICGLTGSGKSRLIQALGEAGEQTLDLERLAAHRGSVLGDLPDEPQPSQKMFESRIWAVLRAFDPDRPVYVESESRKIGELQTPASVIDKMWQSECIHVEANLPVRLALLKEEYRHFLAEPSALEAKFDRLIELYGRETIERWNTLAQAKQWNGLIVELLEKHYDPAYHRSIVRHYLRYPDARVVRVTAPDAFAALAGHIAR